MKNSILIFVLLLSAKASIGQISFYKQFSNNGYDYGEGIVQTEDSSYIITGQSSSFIDGPAEAFLLKVDSLGDYLWSWHYGGPESDGGKRVMYIENDGILVAGYTNSFGAGAYDFYLFKTDVDGNELWSETYGTSSWDRVNDAALTRDSGVIMVGETLNTLDGESDILIVRTDKNGLELWRQQLGGIGEDLINSIEVMDDSTFIFGGKTYVENLSQFKGLLFRMQDNGVVLWMDTIGQGDNYMFTDLSYDANNNVISIVGQTQFNNGNVGIVENKCTGDGMVTGENYADVGSIQYYVGITPIGISDKFATATISNNEFSFGGYDLTFNQNYNYLGWQQGLSGVNYAGDDLLGQIVSTNDLGAIAVGSVTQIGEGGSNIFITKLYESNPFFYSNNDFSTNSFVSLEEVDLKNELKIYPNPVQSNLNIHGNSEVFLNITVFDNTGRLVMHDSFYQDGVLSVKALDNGTYYLHIENTANQSVKTAQIIVAH